MFGDRIIECVDRAIILNRYHKIYQFNSIPNKYCDGIPAVIDQAAIFHAHFRHRKLISGPAGWPQNACRVIFAMSVRRQRQQLFALLKPHIV